MTDSLGDRQKAYENVSRHYLIRRMPVIIRLDGRAMHTFTSSFDRSFDHYFIDAMVKSAKKVAEDMQGFKAGYVQSDEVSFFCHDYNALETEAWFDNNLSKITSISASIMTANFNNFINYPFIKTNSLAYFDGMAWNLPREEVSNYFVFRAKDWARNSLQMYCRSFFSHKELENKNHADMHEMLHQIGKNWANDLRPENKNGIYLFKTEDGIIERNDILPEYKYIASVIEPLVYPLEEGLIMEDKERK